MVAVWLNLNPFSVYGTNGALTVEYKDIGGVDADGAGPGGHKDIGGVDAGGAGPEGHKDIGGVDKNSF